MDEFDDGGSVYVMGAVVPTGAGGGDDQLVAVDPDGWQEMRERLHPGILEDWEANREYWMRHETPITEVAEKVNDTYLKSQGQRDGVGSYRRFVDLLIGDLRRSRKPVDVDGS